MKNKEYYQKTFSRLTASEGQRCQGLSVSPRQLHLH